jgi:hypothetical protein
LVELFDSFQDAGFSDNKQPDNNSRAGRDP